jgi:hypothetical protein
MQRTNTELPTFCYSDWSYFDVKLINITKTPRHWLTLSVTRRIVTGKNVGTFMARSISNITYSESLEKLKEVTPISGSAQIYSLRSNFDVLLTVHLSIVLVINQLDAQNLVLRYVYYMPLHVSSTMCSTSGGQNCIIQPLVSSHL